MGPQQVISLSLLQHQGDTIVEVGKASGGTDPIARAVNAVTPLGGPDFFQAFGITQARPYDLECQQLLQAHLVDIQREHNQALASIGLQVGQAIDLSGYIRRQAQRR